MSLLGELPWVQLAWFMIFILVGETLFGLAKWFFAQSVPFGDAIVIVGTFWSAAFLYELTCVKRL